MESIPNQSPPTPTTVTPSAPPQAPNLTPAPSVAGMLATRLGQTNTGQATPPRARRNLSLVVTVIMMVFGISGFIAGFYFYYRLREVEVDLRVKEIELERIRDDAGIEQEDVQGISDKVQIASAESTLSAQLVSPTPTIIYNGNLIPVGYVAKRTSCFTIHIPRDNTAEVGNNCELVYNATIGDENDLGASIQAEYTKYATLQEMLKAATLTIVNPYVTEGIKEVGGVDAARITETLPDGSKLIHVYVLIPNKYKVGGIMASGFEISKTVKVEDNTRQLQVFEILLATWKWL